MRSCLQSSEKQSKSLINIEYLESNKSCKLVLCFIGDVQETRHTKQQWRDRLSAIGARNKQSLTQTPAASTVASAAVKQETNAASATAAPRVHVPLAVLQSRAACLASDSHLRSLHTQLVREARCVTEEEFWQRRDRSLARSSQQLNDARQSVGLSSTLPPTIDQLIAEQERQHSQSQATSTSSSTATTFRMSLTPQMQHSVFTHEPHVKAAFDQLVVNEKRMDAAVFWQKYFAARAVHQGRAQQQPAATNTIGGKRQPTSNAKANANANANAADIASKAWSETIDRERAAAKAAEDQRSASEAEAATSSMPPSTSRRMRKVQAEIDPSIDLTSADADDAIVRADGDAEQWSVTATVQGSAGRSARAQQQTQLLRLYNQHGTLLMANRHKDTQQSASGVKRTATQAELDKPLVTVKTEPPAVDSHDASSPHQRSYQDRLASDYAFDDLALDKPAQFNELHIKREADDEHHPSGPVPAPVAIAAPSANGDAKPSAMSDIASLLAPLPLSATHHLRLPLSSASRSTLLSISSVSRAMSAAARATKLTEQKRGSSASTSIDQSVQARFIYSTTDTESDIVVPSEFESELARHTLLVSELLTHFWSCFPVQQVQSRLEKLHRVKTALDSSYQKMRDMTQFLANTGDGPLAIMLRPLQAACEKCHLHYVAFEHRQQQQNAANRNKQQQHQPHTNNAATSTPQAAALAAAQLRRQRQANASQAKPPIAIAVQ